MFVALTDRKFDLFQATVDMFILANQEVIGTFLSIQKYIFHKMTSSFFPISQIKKIDMKYPVFSMCRHIYNWDIVACEVKQPIQLKLKLLLNFHYVD